METIHLGFHYVSPTGDVPGMNCPPERLKRHIKALLKQGFEILTCGEVASRLKEGKSLPEKHTTLSFDDGLKSQYNNAFPILRYYGVLGTFFYPACVLDGRIPPVIGLQILIKELGAERMQNEILPAMLEGMPQMFLLDFNVFQVPAYRRQTGESEAVQRIKWVFNDLVPPARQWEIIQKAFEFYCGKDSQKRFVSEWFISSDELKEMQSAGMEIASHSYCHPRFELLGLDEIRNEVKISREKLASVLGKEVKTFAWPFGGRVRGEIKQVVGECYSSAWNFFLSPDEIPENLYKDILDIPRIAEGAFPLE